MTETLMAVSCAVLPENGEDSFAMGQDGFAAYLCVADGCGGLGSRRYSQLNGKTGAYAASRLAVRAVSRWMQEQPSIPACAQEGRTLCKELEKMLGRMFCDFAQNYCQEEKTRIVGSMQRTLPTTLCAAYVREHGKPSKDLMFLWSGDSRGYVLNGEGLHQCTKDHLRPEMDAFESLYRDAPLGNLISAERMPSLSMYRLTVEEPCVILTATDGAFNSLLTPMEFEFLLLDTLVSAKNWTSWEKKLSNRIRKMAQDDATLLLLPCVSESFEAFQQRMKQRRTELQKAFITPVRRRKRDVGFAREKWKIYREQYEWTEGGNDERLDWRI